MVRLSLSLSLSLSHTHTHTYISIHQTAYGSYSDQLKDPPYDFTQSHVNFISSIGNVGLYLGILGGLFNDRFGPTLTVAIGATVCCVGYLSAWLNSNSTLGNPSYKIMAAAFALAWQGGSWIDCASITLTIKNFEKNKGFVLGLVKTFFGLSGSIFGQFYLGFQLKHAGGGSENVPFFLFMALFVIVVSFTVLPSLYVCQGDVTEMNKSGTKAVRFGYLVVSCLAVFLTVVGLVEKVGSGVSDEVQVGLTMLTIFFIITLCVGIIYLASLTSSTSSNYDALHNDEIVDVIKINDDDEEEEEEKQKLPDDDVDANVRDAILSPYFYIVAFSAFAHTGT